MYCRVLIIDDEYIMRQGIRHMIAWEKEGYLLVGEAADGEEGLAMIEKYRPDIVLADIVMPVLDGMEFSQIMKNRFPHIKLIMLSSYDKFEYVKETLLNGACDYILKPSLNPKTLVQSLEKAAAQIPGMRIKKNERISINGRLSRILDGYEADVTQGDFRERFPYTKCRLLLSKDGSRRAENVELLRFLQDYWSRQERYETEVLSAGGEFCLVLVNYRIKDERALLPLINQCVNMALRYCPQSFWVYGESFERLDGLHSVFQKACEMTEQRFYYKDVPLIYDSSAAQHKSVQRFADEQYAEFLKYRNFKAALKQIEDYTSLMCACMVEEYLLKNTVKNLIYHFLSEKEKADGVMAANTSDLFRTIDKSRYVQDFRQELSEIFEKLAAQCKGGVSTEGSLMEIRQYMKEHYAENLELAHLAKEFNYNYNYLSTCFNRKMKAGFSEYLNQIRIEKACEILRTTQHSIAQVSGMVGYSDPSYFSRIFKAQTGRTPSQWKRRNGNV